MLGVLDVMAPGYMIGQSYVPLGLNALRIVELLYYLGLICAVPLTAMAAILLFKSYRDGNYLFGLAIFSSITFLFTMYVSRSYAVGFLSFTVAHGLQYLIFLFAHSAKSGSMRGTGSGTSLLIAAPVALATCIALGYLIWEYAPNAESDQFPLLGRAIIFSITLVHFWVDQFLWRMKDKERASWIKARFGFVFASSR
jgi:hypothetical protein